MDGNARAAGIAIVLLAAVTTLPRSASGQDGVTYPDPGSYVVDQADLIDAATRSKLEGWLRELEQKTTAQVKILTVRTLSGEDIEGFAQRHFDAWKLGQKGKDNGALLVLALEERQFRIATGYGLEGALPDAWCGAAIVKLGRPRFREGNYAQGVSEIATAVINKVADEYGVKLTGVPNLRVAQPSQITTGRVILLVILVIVVFWIVSRRNSRGTRQGGRRGGWRGPWIGPGSFGGGFGGFGNGPQGGGFGGSFGGGGGFGGSFGGGGGSGGGGASAGW